MLKTKYNIVGVMSGTSLDGIDLVNVHFFYDKAWRFEVVHAETIQYSKIWYNTLKQLVSFSVKELQKTDDDYTVYLAKVIEGFIKEKNLKAIDAVCSHGHTALHQPEKKLTYQIGNKPILCEILNEKVVCDFRKQDVELGGQGAPLVPIGDKLLFSEYHFCLNLGGFANISTGFETHSVAYDICPVNIVLNYYVGKLGLAYDDEGQMASKGSLNKDLLDRLNTISFYKLEAPKSLGLEWVNKNIIPVIDGFNLEVSDVLKTFVEHTAIQIASEINKKKRPSVLVTGGGAYNLYLIERLKHHANGIIIIPSKAIIEFKEALIFGFLGVLKLRDEINCLKSVTGASIDHSSGNIYEP